ncbi:surface-adhesin E family protein [Polynucleobacter sp. Fuers-14]|uniref:surface-adhesin E family protein n=1 Tax=Polynucleobacter sp. Fuers-14 TaxID=1758364 RepID=UPI001C0E278F|nr:surface-adhesin E family protein [Polynucleobacter sp. Fuers-14]MBU3640822.1 hypothetical protein [Polynucleobacter sp. Fuers-14]
MKKILLAACFLLIANRASAEWFLIGTNNDKSNTTYIDSDTHKVTGVNSATSWFLMDFKNSMKVGNVMYQSSKTLYEFNCRDDRYRVLAMYFYSKNMGNGDAVSSSEDYKNNDWSSIPPGTVMSAMKKFACIKNK